MLRGLLLLCLIAGSRQLSIKEFAVPTALPAGENAALQCQYSVKAGKTDEHIIVKWWWHPLDSEPETKKQLYQRINKQPPDLPQEHNNTIIHVEVKDNDTIVILNLEPKHSGTYECEVNHENDLTEARKHEELIIYTKGTGPQLNTSLIADAGDDLDTDTDDDLHITCEASGVAPEPELSITLNTEQLHINESVSNSSNGLYSIYADVIISQSRAEGAEISCELFFKKNISHPVYVDTQTYIGAEPTQVTTEDPVREPSLDSASEIPQQSPDGSCQITLSWLLLVTTACAYLKTILCTT